MPLKFTLEASNDHFRKNPKLTIFGSFPYDLFIESIFDKKLKNPILAILRGLDIVPIFTNLSSEKSSEQIWPRSHPRSKNWTKLFFYVHLPDPSKSWFWTPKGGTLQKRQFLKIFYKSSAATIFRLGKCFWQKSTNIWWVKFTVLNLLDKFIEILYQPNYINLINPIIYHSPKIFIEYFYWNHFTFSLATL